MDRGIREVFVIRIHHNMAFALTSQNIKITAFNFDHEPIQITAETIQHALTLLPRVCRDRTILDNFRDVLFLSKSIHALRPEIIHVNALQDLLTVFTAVRIGAISGRKPAIIAMSRNSLSWEDPKKAWLYAKLINLFADGFIALATTHKNLLIGLGVSADKLTVIPNPYDPGYLRGRNVSQHERSAKAARIIYVANICENKAQDVLIEAARLVLKQFPDVQFEFVGKVLQGEEEYARKLDSLIRKYQIGHATHFTGEVPYEEVFTALQKSDIFVFPTQMEMMPRAVIEAMMLGKPVIASAVGGILDLIQDQKTGVLVPVGDIPALADAICALIENPGLADKLGSAGQKFVLAYCSPEKVGAQICDFYEYARKKSCCGQQLSGLIE